MYSLGLAAKAIYSHLLPLLSFWSPLWSVKMCYQQAACLSCAIANSSPGINKRMRNLQNKRTKHNTREGATHEAEENIVKAFVAPTAECRYANKNPVKRSPSSPLASECTRVALFAKLRISKKVSIYYCKTRMKSFEVGLSWQSRRNTSCSLDAMEDKLPPTTRSRSQITNKGLIDEGSKGWQVAAKPASLWIGGSGQCCYKKTFEHTPVAASPRWAKRLSAACIKPTYIPQVNLYN